MIVVFPKIKVVDCFVPKAKNRRDVVIKPVKIIMMLKGIRKISLNATILR